MKKDLLYKILVLIGLFILLIVLLFANKKEDKEVLNTLVYEDMGEPGSKSTIEIYDTKVEVTTTYFCSAVDCKSTTEKETFNYSDENINKLKEYINNNFKNININENELTVKQREVIHGLLLGEYYFEINVEEYKNKIEYTKNKNISYVVYSKEDGSILVKELKINDDYDIVNIDTYKINFSKENLNKLNNYILKEVKNEGSDTIYKYTPLKKDEIKIFKSIEENDESYLNNIENEPKLLYTISYNGINCGTPTLYLYSDNTYEYYYTFSIKSESLTPKIGTYNYDIKKIITNINKYSENDYGIYSIKEENGENYITYNTNIELKELLNSLDVVLEKCLEEE